MRRSIVSVTALLALPLIGLSGCASAPSGPTAEPDANGALRAQGVMMRSVQLGDAESLDDVVAASGELGLIALRGGEKEGNVVVSPASLATALAMLADGAEGKSLSELEAALGASGEQRRDAFAALQGSVRKLDGDPFAATGATLPERPILHLANNLVVDDGSEVLQSYVDALADGFDAGMQTADLGSDQGKAVLDAWVQQHTGGLIEKSVIEPDPDLRVVLQNAVLFAAKWRTPFKPNRTGQAPFTLPNGSSVDVQTMTMRPGEFPYANLDGGWVAVRLPYQEAAHADLLLPPAGVDPSEVTSELLVQAAVRLSEAKPIRLFLSLPTIDASGQDPVDLIKSGVFERAGIGSSLCGGDGTDLSGIAGEHGDLCVAQAAQQAVLRVDEEGTVATAVTELGIDSLGLPGVDETVQFDRPFLFTVVHDETGWPLFQAAIRDPRH